MSFPFHRFLIIGLLVLTVQSRDCFAQDSNGILSDSRIAAAIESLKTNKVLTADMGHGFGSTNDAQYKQYLKIYNEQMDAIDILGKAKISDAAPILIPYLDYTVPEFGGSLRHSSFGINGQDTNLTLRLWPALGALVQIPGSGQVLAEHALDKKIPIKSRIVAFAALKYVDMQRFNSITNEMESEFSKSDFLSKYIKWTEGDDQRYMGTQLLNNLPK